MSAPRRQTAERTDPDPAQRLHDQALERLNASDWRPAVRLYDLAVGHLPAGDARRARWISERGRALMALAHNNLAIRDFDRAMALDPNLLSAPANKATVLQNMGRLVDALEMHERACEIRPNRADVHYNRGNALMELDRQPEALAAYKRAVEVDPSFQRAYSGLINGLWQRGDLDDAKAYADQACARAPSEPENFAARALVRQTLGDLAGARADYEHALGIDPYSIGALFNWVQMDKVRDADDWRLGRLLDAERSTLRQGLERASLHYALGKCYDDLRQVDPAFHHFDRGARIKRANLSYDEEREKRQLGQLIQNFTRRTAEAYATRGLASEQPVFVVGMPRSGTTLTEQILHSHPQVFGAGELLYTNDAVSGVSLGGRLVAADGTVERHGPEVLPERAEQYLARLRGRAPDPEVARIVDKMPGNAWRIGFIHLMFPNARIIHCVRDPLDTCLSCFQKLFAHGQNWSYDLSELGRHYRRYHRVMQHWEEILPGRMLEVRYEDTVADLESQARRIIAHVGLDWDPACLQFHRAERAVQTASHSQVREPLYKSSVRRWHAYRHHLQPLVDALGPLAEHARQAA
jgi:tetratricopeptide (TPR) repeat protein